MSEHDDAPEDEEGEDYEPIPERLMDGEALILDPIEFAEEFDALAVICRDGQLFVLPRKTRKWVSVTEAKKSGATLASVPTTKQ